MSSEESWIAAAGQYPAPDPSFAKTAKNFGTHSGGYADHQGLTMQVCPIGRVTSDLSDLPGRVEITFEVVQ